MLYISFCNFFIYFIKLIFLYKNIYDLFKYIEHAIQKYYLIFFFIAKYKIYHCFLSISQVKILKKFSYLFLFTKIQTLKFQNCYKNI